MKRQYLGDSRDSFKWDYHHHLVPALGAKELQIVWIMTPDEGEVMAGRRPSGSRHDRIVPSPGVIFLDPGEFIG